MSLVFNLCRFSSTEEAPVCNVISLRPFGGEQEDAIKFGVLFVRRSLNDLYIRPLEPTDARKCQTEFMPEGSI